MTQNSLELARTISLDIDPTLRNEHNTSEVIVDREVAKISITGAGMIGRPGIAAKTVSYTHLTLPTIYSV